MTSAWRLIPLSDPSGPAWNMAVDEVLLDEPAGGREEAVVRFYRWSEPCLSIGYFQGIAEAARDLDCEDRGVAAIRRITGGGMVEHGADLTVSFALPVPNGFFPAKAVDFYQALHALFFEGLKGLYPGLYTIPTLSPLRPRSCENCFEEPVAFDIGLDGRKVIGSSQRRRHGRMLNQTAVFLAGDPRRIADAVRGGFERKLGIRFLESPLSAGERERACALELSKYASPEFAFGVWGQTRV